MVPICSQYWEPWLSTTVHVTVLVSALWYKPPAYMQVGYWCKRSHTVILRAEDNWEWGRGFQKAGRQQRQEVRGSHWPWQLTGLCNVIGHLLPIRLLQSASQVLRPWPWLHSPGNASSPQWDEPFLEQLYIAHFWAESTVRRSRIFWQSELLDRFPQLASGMEMLPFPYSSPTLMLQTW